MQTELAKKSVERIYRHPFVTLMILFFLATLSGVGAMRVQLDQSIEVWFLEDDPEIKVYQEFSDLFKTDEIVVIGVFASDVFDLKTWEDIDELGMSAQDLPFVHRVISANNLGFVNPYPNNPGSINPYPDDIEPSLREQVLNNSLLNGTFVSPRGDAAAIVLQLTREGNTFANKRVFVDALNELLARHDSLNTLVAGTPITDDTLMRHNEHDMSRIVPLMILIILIACYLCFRRVVPTFLPLLVVLVAVLWMFGLMGALGYKYTLVSTTLMPLILTVGVADSIHILAQYKRQRICHSHKEAVLNSVTRLLVPCFFTSVTTAAGLLSLLVSDLAPIREFGLVAAFGVMAAFVVSLFGLTAGLALTPKHRFVADVNVRGGTAEAYLALLSHWSERRRGVIVGSALLLACIFGVLTFQVSVGVNPIAWFDEDDPVLTDALAVDDAFGGSIDVEFLVSGKDKIIQNRAILERIDEFERWLEDETPVHSVLSIVDILKEIGRNDQLEEGAQPALPSDAGLALIFGQPSHPQFTQWVDPAYANARLSARIPLTAVVDAIRAMPSIESHAEEHFRGSGLAVEITGYAPLMVKMQNYLLRGQIETLALAFVAIGFIVALLLRSVMLATIAMLTNLIPVLIGIGIMPLLGITLNPGTVMVGAIVLGIVVDDTVHFLTALRRHGAESTDMSSTIRHSLEEVGIPVIITSALLAIGFAVFIMSSFVPSREVGLVTTVVIIAALIGDLLLLPAILQMFPDLVSRTVRK